MNHFVNGSHEPRRQVFCCHSVKLVTNRKDPPIFRWLMAGGSLAVPPGPVINHVLAISRTVLGCQWTATGRART